ncbi:MAG: hypothetical protein GY926_11550 [bacterium]|nr:hypothetical protein [bacterium]
MSDDYAAFRRFLAGQLKYLLDNPGEHPDPIDTMNGWLEEQVDEIHGDLNEPRTGPVVIDHVHYPVTDTAGAYCGICGQRYVTTHATGTNEPYTGDDSACSTCYADPCWCVPGGPVQHSVWAKPNGPSGETA